MPERLDVVGQRAMPVYGEGKATGTTKFAPDVNLPGMVWMKILRSPHAHGRIVDVDTAEAEKMPGVVGTLTPKDVPQILFGPFENDLYPLDEEIRFVGDSVAAVAAEDWNIAEEATRAIRVRYDLLPAVHDLEAGAQQGSPIAVLHLPRTTTYCWWDEVRDLTLLSDATNVVGRGGEEPTVANRRGDVQMGLAESDAVVERIFRQPHMNGVAHEPRACVASWADGYCTLWCSVQEPYKVQNMVSRVLEIPEENVRVVSTTIGGGFGVKVGGRFAVLAALMARKVARPVKIWFTREEETLDSHNRPGLVHYIKAGAKKDGSLTAVQVRTYFDNGYWVGGSGKRLADSLAETAMDLYHACPNVLWEVFVTRTNHPAGGPFRGRGDAESHFPMECAMDELAEALDLSPIEMRLKNTIREGEPLYSEPGKVVSSVGLEEAVRSGAKAIGWERRQRVPGSTPGPVKRGIGMAIAMHSAGSLARPSQTALEIDQDGGISFFSGQTDQGSEQQTTLRQMVAEILRLPLDAIGGTNADTSNCPRDAGPIASRTVYSTGIAATRAAEEAKRKLLDGAAKLMEVSVDDLELGQREIRVRGTPARNVGFAEVARSAGGTIRAEGYFNAKDDHRSPKGFAAAFAEVEVDTETGEVKVVKLVSSHDVGRAINPTIVEGQIHGGIGIGVGYSLTEGFYFDHRTGTALNQWFLDLKTPSSLDTPEIQEIMVELGEPTHPFGAKGCSEISTIGVAPAIANAVYNAIGVRVRELPITPDRVLEALRASARGRS